MKEKTRANSGLPPDAKTEILEALCANMEITGDEIAAILKQHHVAEDEEILQDRYRRQLGQRLMASLRDDSGKREVLANGRGKYIVVACCNDEQNLKAIRRRIQNQMKGLDATAGKVRVRIHALERLKARFTARKCRKAA